MKVLFSNEYDVFDAQASKLNSFRPQFDPFTVAAVAAISIATAVGNYFMTKNANEQNREWQQEDQKHQDQREDTALSRRVADAQNAGLSPLAALQTGAAQSTTISQAPAQASQMDMSSLIGYITDNEVTDTKTTADKDIAKLRADTDLSIEKSRSETSDKNRENALKISKLEIQKDISVARANIRSNQRINADNNVAAQQRQDTINETQQAIAGADRDERARESDNALVSKDNEMNLEYAKSLNTLQGIEDSLSAGAAKYSVEQMNAMVQTNVNAEKSWANLFGVRFKAQAVDVDLNNPEDLKKYEAMLSTYRNRQSELMGRYQTLRDGSKGNELGFIRNFYSHSWSNNKSTSVDGSLSNGSREGGRGSPFSSIAGSLGVTTGDGASASSTTGLDADNTMRNLYSEFKNEPPLIYPYPRYYYSTGQAGAAGKYSPRTDYQKYKK